MPSYLIVGAGVFGLSTAYHLLLDGEKDVTVVDRSSVLPAPDAASNDINRIVRSSYNNPLYTNLTMEAIQKWQEDFPGVYHESGVLILGDTGYAELALANDRAAGVKMKLLPDEAAIRAVMPPNVPLGPLHSQSGYLNMSSGWADAAFGITALLHKVEALGGRVLPGKHVTTLLYNDDGAAAGIRTSDNEETSADVVVLATGSWTPSAFQATCPGLIERLTATGQSVGFIQLTPDELTRYKDMPVYLSWNSGFYMFPPNQDGLLKFAIHDSGYIHLLAESTVSSPRTVTSHGQAGLFIPKIMEDQLRTTLKAVFPELGARPFTKTRLCWYSDTPDGDWIIDEHPEHKNLFIATGGNGHAYKFLPILGNVVLQRIRGKLSADAAATWSFTRSFVPHERPDRLHQPLVLNEAELTDTLSTTP